MSKESKIRRRKVKEFNNWMSPNGLQQLIENLNDKQKEAIKQIDFEGFFRLQVDGKLAVWSAYNFSTCSCILLRAYGRMRVTEHDVHMTLGIPKGPRDIIEVKMKATRALSLEMIEMMQSQVCGGDDFRRNSYRSSCLHVFMKPKSRSQLPHTEHASGFGVGHWDRFGMCERDCTFTRSAQYTRGEEIHVHVADVEMRKKEQEGSLGSENAKCEMLKNRK
ncbi:LOW QUALITY PROTEIN: hypothetical protein Cgig2_012316 [Carnegiea gigantea]|uniref:Uncharacterized protein n=1 Tax=Carnegiea gigantea TaxID=171969 RepID=A0A9Q1GMS1_9CARY|nr:LOW QUALITY PROTEIN: hypothetical protein Cgig2_012316 [Carnegiea gigantea]